MLSMKILSGAVVCALCLATVGLADDKLDFFETKIRPVLVDKCYSCHSLEAAEKDTLKGNFYIDMREGLLRGGESGPAVIPGQPEKSLLLQVIRHEIIDMQMPPKKAKLSDAQIADMETWIKDGCTDPRTGQPPVAHERVIDLDEARTFWSFRPLEKAALPAVKDGNWSTNPIDQFVLHELEAKQIPVAPEAPRAVLIRRLYLGLTGLAPSEAEVTAFVNDADPQSWNKLVDSALASPHFGERWARHWLDLARFAESNGYAFDKDRKGAFHYRDFVIKALNEDLPYDEFIRMQLAGDLIDDKSFDHLAATGFIAAGPFTSQQTAKERERSRYEQLDDLIATVGTAMLGLSVACARCHDHKFDPVSADDYYSMVAAFGKTGFQTVGTNFEPEVYATAKAEFERQHQPVVDALKTYEEGELRTRALEWQQKWLANEVDDALLATVQKTWEETQIPIINRGGLKQYAIEMRASSATGKAVIQTGHDHISLLSGENPATVTYTLEGTVARAPQIAAIMLEVFADDGLAGKGPGRASNGNFVLSNFTVELNGKPLKLSEALADFSQGGYPIANAIDDNPKSGWAVAGGTGKDHIAIFKLEQPITANEALNLKFVMDHQFGSSHCIGKFRLRALSDFPKATKDIEAGITVPDTIAAILLKDTRNDDEARAVRDYYLRTNSDSPFVAQGWRQLATKETIDLSKTDFATLDETWKAEEWKDDDDINTNNGYVYRRIDSTREYPVELTLKVNGNAECWLNGESVLARKNGNFKQDDKRHIYLRKGANDLLIKFDAKNNKPRFKFTLKPGLNSGTLALINQPELAPEELASVTKWYAPYDDAWTALKAEIEASKAKEPKPDLTEIYQAKKNGTTYGKYEIHHLVRGNSDVKLEPANPGFIDALVRPEVSDANWLKDPETTEPRVAFADWMTDAEQGAGSLLARVAVNRIWKQHMGKGLVASASNFGKTGDQPTHPELLDWLAMTLVENDWSQKSIHRLILASSVYRQGVATSEIGNSVDPGNDLLWTRRRQRIEAEVIRDRLLQMSGELDTSMYGKGTLSLNDARRSVYLTVKRSKLLPFLQLFDAPDAIEGKEARNETNSAPQSLTLLNSPFVRQMSAKLAARISADSNEAVVKQLYWETFSREPRAEEMRYLSGFLALQTSLYKGDAAAAKKATVDLCQLLICSNEFVYID
ncbi:MAG: hypothetical protein ACI8W8_003675 [Rhodothermales bacterium]|jgi:hypothetical protein